MAHTNSLTLEVYLAAGGWTRRNNEQRGIYKSNNAVKPKKFFISGFSRAIGCR
jgi:hypothetical protein